MKKILLLTTTILLSSASVYAVCNPNLPACQCSYPKMINGIIGCSETYCETGTKCMPDGSCCPRDNYCESSEKGKQCCSNEQTCDTTNGCAATRDLETLCANGDGTILSANNGEKYCFVTAYRDDPETDCLNNGMQMASMSKLCPDWDGPLADGTCSNLVNTYAPLTGTSNHFVHTMDYCQDKNFPDDKGVICEVRLTSGEIVSTSTGRIYYNILCY